MHFTLDALNRPNTHRRGRWIGFATCPCGLASERGAWESPKGLFFVFEVVLKDTESVLFCQKDTKTTKNTPNLQIQKENNKKSNEIKKQRLTMLSIMITLLSILITLEIQ